MKMTGVVLFLWAALLMVVLGLFLSEEMAAYHADLEAQLDSAVSR